MTWKNHKNRYRVSLLAMSMVMTSVMTMGLGSALAGPNQDAGLFIDVDYRTVPVDSQGTVAYGTHFWIGVRIADARYLDTFGFRLGFDSSLVGFVKAVPESPADGVADFLESRGGTSVGFLGRISGLDSNQVAIGNGLTGQDSSKTPGGSGLLVLLEFLAKGSTPGKAVFSISDVKLLDWQQSLDTLVSVHTGAVILSPPVTLLGSNRTRRPDASRLESIALALNRSPSKSGFYLLGRRN